MLNKIDENLSWIKERRFSKTDTLVDHKKEEILPLLDKREAFKLALRVAIRSKKIGCMRILFESMEDDEKKVVAAQNSIGIRKLFEGLLKGTTTKEMPETGFRWRIDTVSIRWILEKLDLSGNLKQMLKEKFLVYLKRDYNITTARSIFDDLKDNIDFKDEVREAIGYYLQRSDPIAADFVIHISDTFGEDMDLFKVFSDNKKRLGHLLESAARKGDFNRTDSIIKKLGCYFNPNESLRKAFEYNLKHSYNNALLLYKLMQGVYTDDIIRKVFLNRLKRRNIKIARDLKNDFGEGLNLNEEAYSAIDYLENEGFNEEARRIGDIFLFINEE